VRYTGRRSKNHSSLTRKTCNLGILVLQCIFIVIYNKQKNRFRFEVVPRKENVSRIRCEGYIIMMQIRASYINIARTLLKCTANNNRQTVVGRFPRLLSSWYTEYKTNNESISSQHYTH